MNEYLLELRSQHVLSTNSSVAPEVGEVVVVEGLLKRNTWRVGKVVKLIQAKDEQCQAAVVKTFDGSNHKYIRRPIKKLYPTEIKSAEPVTTEEETSASCTTSENNTVSLENSHKSRPVRAAAEKGIARRRMEGQS